MHCNVVFQDGQINISQQYRRAVAQLHYLLRAVEDYLRRGRPGGTMLIESASIEPGDVLKRGERLVDAVEQRTITLP